MNRSLKFRIFANLSVLVLVGSALGACSGSKSEDASKLPRPPECGKNDKSPEADSDACAKALFNQKVDLNATKSVSKLDEGTRVELADKVCAAAKELPTKGVRPSRADFIAQIGIQLKVDPRDLDQLAAASESLCPAEFKALEKLPPMGAAVQVEFAVEGRGKIKVSYTNSAGAEAEEEGFAPWKMPVTFQQPNDLVLTVIPVKVGDKESKADKDDMPDPEKLKCAISVNGKVLKENSFDAATGSLECRVNKVDLIAASSTTTAPPTAESN